MDGILYSGSINSEQNFVLNFCNNIILFYFPAYTQGRKSLPPDQGGGVVVGYGVLTQKNSFNWGVGRWEGYIFNPNHAETSEEVNSDWGGRLLDIRAVVGQRGGVRGSNIPPLTKHSIQMCSVLSERRLRAYCPQCALPETTIILYK